MIRDTIVCIFTIIDIVDCIIMYVYYTFRSMKNNVM